MMSFDVVCETWFVFEQKDKDIEQEDYLYINRENDNNNKKTSEMRWRGLLKDLKDTSIYFLWGLREDDEDEDFFNP